ncbi:phage/plasmid primase, P4 family [uncultured Roseibium sp.]|uniref:phage/plasmid primase, P4 family n=1 Tax=uncultured Roseibium sp. TaxID=1936171 RepID=UPI002616DCE4|nr:phage/plasmid primase, P4 family [uncultured Roseibium sp.]
MSDIDGQAQENAEEITQIRDIIDNAPPDDGAPPPMPPSDEPLAPGEEGNPADLLCALEPETDIGNGRRFLHRNKDDVLHVSNIGWHVFDGWRWAEDEDNRFIRPRAHQTAEAILDEIQCILPTRREELAREAAVEVEDEFFRIKGKGAKANDEEKAELKRIEPVYMAGVEAEKALSGRRSARRRYAKTSGSSGKLDNMLREAAPYRAKLLRQMDADPLAVNLSSGTLRFVSEDDPDNPEPDEPRRIWAVRHDEHCRDDFISKLMPVKYDKAAKAPQFDKFLCDVQPHAPMRGFLKRYFGYCFTALTSEQVFVFFYGEGRNGKSTLVDLIAQIMADYSTTVPFETLAGDDRRKGGEATPDLARLPGARLVRAAEPEQGMKFRESMIKSLTSGEPILIRRLHAEFNEVYPTFKLVISGNHKPDVRGADDGIWRRVLLVPWEVQVEKDKVDKRLPEKLWEERAGVLNWLIEGALEYLQYGLMIPDEVRAATDTYREESDPVGAFIEAYCEITGDPDDEVDPKTLYVSYKKFCEEQSHNVWKAAAFNRQMPHKAKKMGFQKAKTRGLTIYRGLKMKWEVIPTALDDDAHA